MIGEKSTPGQTQETEKSSNPVRDFKESNFNDLDPSLGSFCLFFAHHSPNVLKITDSSYCTNGNSTSPQLLINSGTSARKEPQSGFSIGFLKIPFL